jgi:hypothetical protein
MAANLLKAARRDLIDALRKRLTGWPLLGVAAAFDEWTAVMDRLFRALDETDQFVRNLMERRSTSHASKGKFAGALLYFLRQCRPVQLLADENAIDKGIDATRFQDLVCVMFVCEYILQYQPPRGILLELNFLLRQNEINVPSLGLLFESLLVMSGREGPYYMDEAVV